MATSLAEDVRNLRAEAIRSLCDGGSLVVYGGPRPGSTLGDPTRQLVSFNLFNPAFQTPVAGAIALNPPEQETATTSGAPEWFRIYTADQEPVLDGTVGTHLVLNTGNISRTDTVRVLSLVVTEASCALDPNTTGVALSVPLRNARVQVILDAIVGGELQLKDGTQPESGVDSGDTLGTLAITEGLFGRPFSGQSKVVGSPAVSMSAGIVEWFRLVGPGDTFVLQGDVNLPLSGADLELINPQVDDGDEVTLDRYAIADGVCSTAEELCAVAATTTLLPFYFRDDMGTTASLAGVNRYFREHDDDMSIAASLAGTNVVKSILVTYQAETPDDMSIAASLAGTNVVKSILVTYQAETPDDMSIAASLAGTNVVKSILVTYQAETPDDMSIAASLAGTNILN